MIHRGLSGITIGATSALIAQSVWAAPVEVTAVQLNPTSNGVEVILDTQGNNRAQVFTVSRGNSSVADITNTQLRLPGGQPFRQDNPAPGIASVVVSQLDENTVQVVVSGTTKAPTGQVIRRDGPGLVLSFSQVPGSEEATTPASNQTQPPSTGQRPNPTPAFLPRAVAPPVGDIAIAPTDVTPSAIDLGTSAPISLTLRDVPVREVLTVIGRQAAELNIAYVDDGKTKTLCQASQGDSAGGGQPQQPQGSSTSEGARISLDIKNESAQEVFNYVLQVACLEANRVGNTIFVSPRLPDDIRGTTFRTLRLNQVPAVTAANFLAAQGADFQVPINRIEIQTIGEGATARTVEVRTPTIETVKPEAQEVSGPLPLRGLSVSVNERVNFVSLVGPLSKVQIAASLLTQLDLRRRQVAVNVKVVDVDLTKTRNANASLQFNSGVATGNSVVANFIGGVFQIGAPIGTDFLLNLFGSIQDQNAKILTNPTLIVQEGETAQVTLANQVFQGFEIVDTDDNGDDNNGDDNGNISTLTRRPILADAGVTLNIEVDQIDDNGFINLILVPEVSSPTGSFVDDDEVATLLSRRSLNTGQIRLRDGQTLVLTGIIQDTETDNVSKVPILGDIPILGRLFRNENRSKNRREVVVIVTPQILDDSDQSSFGYQYNPSPEAEKRLNR